MAKQLDFSKIAKEFSKRGASKGGKARANVLTPQERSEIAKKAVETRWGKVGKLKQKIKPIKSSVEENLIEKPDLPYSLFRGTLNIGGLKLECHVLNDHRRVFTQREVVRIMTGGHETGNLSQYLIRNPLIDRELILGKTFPFKIPGINTDAIGYEAPVLIDICDKFLQANDEGLIKPTKGQMKLVAQAGIVVRACAKTGIIALIDEATGFQEHRAKNALRIKLYAFIAEDMQEWAKMFPDEFWFELAKLESIRYSPRSRPLRWGKYVMMFVYDSIDKDVGKELREKNPNPHHRKNHHQWLKEFGRDKVHDQITKVVTIMKLCNDMDEFKRKFKRVFQKNEQTDMFDIWDM